MQRPADSSIQNSRDFIVAVVLRSETVSMRSAITRRYLAARETVAAGLSEGSNIRFHVLFLLVLTVLSWSGVVAAPILLHYPIVLAALSPRLTFLSLAAVVTSLPVFLFVGVTRLCLADPVNFDLGKRLSPTLHSKLKSRRWVGSLVPEPDTMPTRTRRVLLSVLIFARPNSVSMNLAGACRLHPVLVASLSIGGSLVYLLALYHGLTLLNT